MIHAEGSARVELQSIEQPRVWLSTHAPRTAWPGSSQPDALLKTAEKRFRKAQEARHTEAADEKRKLPQL